jgi:hypothetical protein
MPPGQWVCQLHTSLFFCGERRDGGGETVFPVAELRRSLKAWALRRSKRGSSRPLWWGYVQATRRIGSIRVQWFSVLNKVPPCLLPSCRPTPPTWIGG